MNNRKFTVKFLGVFMESVNNSAKEFRRNLWSVVFGASFLLFVWSVLSILEKLASSYFG